MTSLTKNRHPQPKKLFRVQTRRLAASFELLNSSLPLSAPELHAHKAMCNPVVLAQKSPKPARRQSKIALPELQNLPHISIIASEDIPYVKSIQFILTTTKQSCHVVLFDLKNKVHKKISSFQENSASLHINDTLSMITPNQSMH